jgi:hypothetical protein
VKSANRDTRLRQVGVVSAAVTIALLLTGCGPVWDELAAVTTGPGGRPVFLVQQCEGDPVDKVTAYVDDPTLDAADRIIWQIVADSASDVVREQLEFGLFEAGEAWTTTRAPEIRSLAPSEEYRIYASTPGNKLSRV